ncbi:MAG TPA: DUF2784 domain-containing protein [Gemmatimonadales bacterium]|nr:DUF2784 domain-containing protein [Gemmatimonadales bacterium]
MAWLILADLVLAVHLAFVVFVVAGGLLVLRRPAVAWVHVPCAAWAVFVEFAGIVCPLTPLENALRRAGGASGYAGDFVGHYITAVLYPNGLTRGVQIALGALVLALNVGVYATVITRRRSRV